MRWLSIAILMMAVFAFSPTKSAQADDFSFSIGFHDELSPYGSWVNYSSYGNVWRPHAYSGWRPYMDGYWGYTNYGPTWYGNEAYAPYVYHYGNWIYTARYGWVWIPGYDWHPGRVNWSYGGGYIGWRPMFPSGYDYYGGNDYNFWVVIDSDRFGYNSYRPYALRSTLVRDLFARRVFRQRYNTFRRAELERIVRRPLRTLNVRERTVRIGNRRARLLATADDEVRIRKHVTQIRGRGDDRRVERDTVMKRKFDDIRSKSEVRRSNSGRRDDYDRSKTIRRSDDVRSSKQKVEKSRKTYTPSRREIEKKSKEKPSKSSFTSRKSDRDNDRVQRSSYSSRKPAKVERSSYSSRKPAKVERSTYSSRKPSKVERSSYSVRKSEVRSKGKEVSKAKNTSRKETSRKQKPRNRS